MGRFPLNPQRAAMPRPEWVAAIEPLADELAASHPEFALPAPLRPLACPRLRDAPTIHLDDLSAIPFHAPEREVYLQERARLRAMAGETVLIGRPRVRGYETYLRNRLGLGRVSWLEPTTTAKAPWHLVRNCRRDAKQYAQLVAQVRSNEQTDIHPHQGIAAVWRFAARLAERAERSVRVVAPPPGLCAWVNDKIAFATVARRLFGPDAVPRSVAAADPTTLAAQVADIARNAQQVVIKRPSGAGGEGNLLLDARILRRLSLRAIREHLSQRFAELRWPTDEPFLVGQWKTDVLGSPSAQTWIPPLADGPPIVEGLFDQLLDGDGGAFLGFTRASLTPELEAEAIERAWILAALWQQLGYVGRCSFDMLLVGPRLADARLELIECNGRWGGTSGPMTLLTRVFGRWDARPFVAHECHLPGLASVSFRQLLATMKADLYDYRTGRGHVIFFTPGQLAIRSGIQFLALGDTWKDAQENAVTRIPERLANAIESVAGVRT